MLPDSIQRHDPDSNVPPPLTRTPHLGGDSGYLSHVAKQQEWYSGPEYNIEWTEVEKGKAAGMPGMWVCYGRHARVVGMLWCYRSVYRQKYSVRYLIFTSHLKSNTVASFSILFLCFTFQTIVQEGSRTEDDESGTPPPSLLAETSEEEEILQALRLKAEAFASKSWENYWLVEGPRLLASGWLGLYPHIPLARVERVCSIDFLCETVKSLDLEGGEGMEGGDVPEQGGGEESVSSRVEEGREKDLKGLCKWKPCY